MSRFLDTCVSRINVYVDPQTLLPRLRQSQSRWALVKLQQLDRNECVYEHFMFVSKFDGARVLVTTFLRRYSTYSSGRCRLTHVKPANPRRSGEKRIRVTAERRGEMVETLSNAILSMKSPASSIGSCLQAPKLPQSVNQDLSVMCAALQAKSAASLENQRRHTKHFSCLETLLMPYPQTVYPVGRCFVFPRHDNIYRPRTIEQYSFFKALFVAISRLQKVSIGIHDLHHGHMFYNTSADRLGILFHHTEYPSYCEKTFPYNLGYCQRGSNVSWTNDRRRSRNVLWMLGARWIVAIDCSEGSQNECLIMEEKKELATIDETLFGDVRVADLFYFEQGINRGVHIAPYL